VHRDRVVPSGSRHCRLAGVAVSASWFAAVGVGWGMAQDGFVPADGCGYAGSGSDRLVARIDVFARVDGDVWIVKLRDDGPEDQDGALDIARDLMIGRDG
jgi:hypothetical protein